MRIRADGFSGNELVALKFLLYPYQADVSEEVDEADLVICKGSSSPSFKPMIRVPARTDRQISYKEPKNCTGSVVDLPFDLITACLKKLESVMNPKTAFSYNVLTRLPFQYTLFPSSMRSWFLKTRLCDVDLSKHLANEMARRILVEAFDLLGCSLRSKNPASLMITHDIDTEKGLRRALRLKAVEDKLDMQSTWFLPSDEYPIPSHVARELAERSTIGSHDIKHDGRLVHINRHDELVERLTTSRLRLEDIFEKDILYFRSPLLQFDHRILTALGEAGYRFDFSLPCWEPVHPRTRSGFGVESAKAFRINDITELPLTLYQDHQLLYVLGMNTTEAAKFWIEQAKLIRKFEGDIVLLVHPDYSFSQDLNGYKELLNSLLEICATPSVPDNVLGALLPK